jgi:uncharacterized protein (TIGR00299 family) protein
MILGGILGLGIDPEDLRTELKKLNVTGYRLEAAQVVKKGIAARQVTVQVTEPQPHRGLKEIRGILSAGALSPWVKETALRIFTRILETEAAIHNTSPDRVHLHEVGAVDAIVDICGALVGFEMLGVEKFFASALRLGKGTLTCSHGVLPIPAPATMELLKGVPVFSGDEEGEMTTPTGAAIVSTLAENYGGLPLGTVSAIGYGAGTRDFISVPNVLRLILGSAEQVEPKRKEEKAIVIEANIDDMNPQICGYVMNRLLEAGAYDVYFTAVQMKKSRPGVLMTILCPDESMDAMLALLFQETTTIGVRFFPVSRSTLDRRTEKVETEYGPVRLKVSAFRGRTVNVSPEYEDCRELAARCSVSLKEVQAAAVAAFRRSVPPAEAESERKSGGGVE